MENSEFQLPHETPLQARPSKRGLAISGLILLALSIVLPIWGTISITLDAATLIDTSYDDLSYENEVFVNDFVSEDEIIEDLDRIIDRTLGALIGSGIAGLLGSILASISLFKQHNREKWFYWTTIALALLLGLFTFPFGIIVTIYLLTIFIMRKGEFYANYQKSL